MSGKKVSSLTAITSAQSADEIYVINGGNSRKITTGNLADTMPVTVSAGATSPLSTYLATVPDTKITPTGATTARTLAAIFADVINVKFFGATGDGVTDDASAFQAAVDAITDGDRAVIRVPEPSSSYKIDSALTLGTRIITWLECNGVSYSGTQADAALGGTRMFASYKSDATRPGMVGSWIFGKDVTTGESGDYPTLRVQRNAEHTGGTTGGSIESSALNVYSKISSTVQNYETTLIAEIDNEGANLAGQNLVALHADAQKNSNGVSNTFGANLVAQDLTGNASATSGGGLVGCEITMRASGADNATTRVGLDVVHKAKSGDVSNASFAYGIRVRAENASVSGSITNALYVSNGTNGGSISTGLYINADHTGGQAIKVKTKTNAGILRLGSDKSTNGAVVSNIFWSGENSASSDFDYAEMRAVQVTVTSGSEEGRFDFRRADAGSMATVMQLDNHPTDPAVLMVSGSLKRVTEGAADSGGSGFKVLRVPN